MSILLCYTECRVSEVPLYKTPLALGSEHEIRLVGRGRRDGESEKRRVGCIPFRAPSKIDRAHWPNRFARFGSAKELVFSCRDCRVIRTARLSSAKFEGLYCIKWGCRPSESRRLLSSNVVCSTTRSHLDN